MKLAKVEKYDRYLFYGTFDRAALRYLPYKGKCIVIVITNVRDQYGNYVCNHVEFNDIKGFDRLHLEPGDGVSFRARVVACQNAEDAMYGFINKYTGIYYRLMNPTKVTKLICPISHLIEQPQCKIKIEPTKR